MRSNSKTIEELETLLRAGHTGRAKHVLSSLTIKKIPRADALPLANLARRLEMSKLSLKILRPIVCPERHRKLYEAKASEKVEYAASLRGLGVIGEATRILESVDFSEHPQAAIQLAFCHITEWRYESAIPVLKAYLKTFREPSYAMYIGKLNLLEALIHSEKKGEAEPILKELRGALDPNQHALAYLKWLDLAAQYEIFLAKRPDRAIPILEKARQAAEKTQNSPHPIIIEKWLAVARSLIRDRAMPELAKVRKRAEGLQFWEIVRDCDFYSAILGKNRGRLIRLYFGTPFEPYRVRILRALGPAFALPLEYLWRGGQGSMASPIFELATAGLRGANAALTPGQAVHRLLILLCQDFYRPVPLLAIFSKLHPSETYHPESSPNRVHQLLFRFRRWIRECSLPLTLEELDESYRLRLTGPLAIAVPRSPLPLISEDLEFVCLRSRIPKNSFTCSEAALKLGLSSSSIQTLLQWAIREGKLTREGQGRNTFYKFRTE